MAAINIADWFRSAKQKLEAIAARIRSALRNLDGLAARSAALAIVIQRHGDAVRALSAEDAEDWLAPLTMIIDMAVIAERVAGGRGLGAVKAQQVREQARTAIRVADTAFDEVWDRVLSPALSDFIALCNARSRSWER